MKMAPQVVAHPGTRPTEKKEWPVDATRIPPSGDPFTVKQSQAAAKCAGCGKVSPRRDLIVVHEGRHDNLVYFHGDKLCRRCARRNGVSY